MSAITRLHFVQMCHSGGPMSVKDPESPVRTVRLGLAEHANPNSKISFRPIAEQSRRARARVLPSRYGLWLIYLTFATTLNISLHYTLPGG
jgi:hypothetical protein